MNYLLNDENPVSIEELKLSQNSDNRYESAFFLCVHSSKDTFHGRRLKIRILDINGMNVTCKIDSVHSGDGCYPLPNDHAKYVTPETITVDINHLFPPKQFFTI